MQKVFTKKLQKIIKSYEGQTLQEIDLKLIKGIMMRNVPDSSEGKDRIMTAMKKYFLNRITGKKPTSVFSPMNHGLGLDLGLDKLNTMLKPEKNIDKKKGKSKNKKKKSGVTLTQTKQGFSMTMNGLNTDIENQIDANDGDTTKKQQQPMFG